MALNVRFDGWLPDKLDHRDVSYRSLRPDLLLATYQPPRVDLRGKHFPAIFDQGRVGSCVANATSAACAYAISVEDFDKEGYEPTVLSRLFIYWEARENKLVDSGTYIREAMKVLSRKGAPREELWPYDQGKWSVQPVQPAYDEAAHREVNVVYYRLDNTDLNQLLDCLAQGFPIVFGAAIYGPIMDLTATDCTLPLPTGAQKPLGGHAMLIVGYDKARKAFLVRNSWGTEWGDGGHFWIPFSYLTNPMLADDFWTVRHIAR